jgi:hypothetical protein
MTVEIWTFELIPVIYSPISQSHNLQLSPLTLFTTLYNAMLLQMQGRQRVFEGKGDKRVFGQQDYSYNIDPFEVPQKLAQRTVPRMSSSAEKDEHDDVKLSSVVEPHENDVLLGRGGKNNRHSGNEQLRQMARQYREDYQIATKKGKSQLSRQLVHQVRELSPPGR